MTQPGIRVGQVWASTHRGDIRLRSPNARTIPGHRLVEDVGA